MSSGQFPSVSSISRSWVGVYLVVFSVGYFAFKVVRNLYFHPLSKYPGPKLWAATDLVNNYHLLRGSRVYAITEFHNKYGPIVRVGPNELSYVHEDAWKDIYGIHKTPGSLELSKDLWASAKGRGLFNHPIYEDHNRIRKVLAPAFSEKSIREHEGVLQKYTSLLIQRLKEQSQRGAADLLFWFDCLGADLSGYFAFGVDFNALESSKLPDVLLKTDHFLRMLAINTAWNQYTLTYLLLGALQILDHPGLYYYRLVMKMMTQRQARFEQAGTREGDLTDFVSHLSKNVDTPKGLSKMEVTIVSADLIIAGSDTSASTLSGCIFHLCNNQAKLHKLAQELRSAFKSEEEITLTAVNGLKYQNAVLNEALRLFPAAPETGRRLTNKGGNVICGDTIPGNTRVGVYHWAAGHHAASWKNVNEFIPERWIGDKNYENDNREVVQPFNVGPRNCIGQNLAMAQMRLVLAKLVWNFDMELCKESDDWLKMGAHGLVYRKRPLMVKLKSIRA